jgi:hypothetical protein
LALLAALVFIAVRLVVLCRDVAADDRHRVGGVAPENDNIVVD